jgi:hypothetical protein
MVYTSVGDIKNGLLFDIFEEVVVPVSDLARFRVLSYLPTGILGYIELRLYVISRSLIWAEITIGAIQDQKNLFENTTIDVQ